MVPMCVFIEVTLHLITHLPPTEHGYDSMVTFVNRLSKYICSVLCALHVTVLKVVQVFLVTVVAKHEMLLKWISDYDPYFTSYFWHEFVLILGCKHALSTAYHPQTGRQTKYMHYSIG